MICIIALVVFGILGIFSASHRKLAKEAFNCVFRRLTLRKCETSFDKRMRAKVAGKLMKRSPKLSKFVFKYFEAISWILTIVLIVSIVLSARGLYYLATEGTCDPSNPDACPFGEAPVEEECPTCEVDCDCSEVGCDIPEYEACEGDCDCIKEICEIS